MAKSIGQIDVLVLGEHPAAYLAAALLRYKSKYRVAHSTIPGERYPDRLVMINPEFFELHPLLEPLRRKIEGKGVYGLQFLADDPAIRSEYRSRSAVACVAQFKAVQGAMEDLARGEDVLFLNPDELQVIRLDEHGIELTADGQKLNPTAVVLAGRLPENQERILGLPEEWEHGVVHRYSYVMLRGTRLVDGGGRPLVPMSLDLNGLLSWAWLLPGPRHTQLAVEQPLDQVQQHSPVEMLRRWAAVLERQGVLRDELEIDNEMVQSMDMPMGGALTQEGLANRTLLIGPAGGFYTASGEDVYPNCWSAIYAAEVLKKALKEPHFCCRWCIGIRS